MAGGCQGASEIGSGVDEKGYRGREERSRNNIKNLRRRAQRQAHGSLLAELRTRNIFRAYGLHRKLGAEMFGQSHTALARHGSKAWT